MGIHLVDLQSDMLQLRNSVSACPSSSQVTPVSVLVGDHAPLGDLGASPPSEFICKLDRFSKGAPWRISFLYADNFHPKVLLAFCSDIFCFSLICQPSSHDPTRSILHCVISTHLDNLSVSPNRISPYFSYKDLHPCLGVWGIPSM